MLEIEKFGDLPKDASDYSYYITRILNSCMADLCLAEYRQRDKNFRMKIILTQKDKKELCEIIAVAFEKCCKHAELRTNLKEFTNKNGFDYYYRFLVYLYNNEFELAFNRIGLSLVQLMVSSKYRLPDLYRS